MYTLPCLEWNTRSWCKCAEEASANAKSEETSRTNQISQGEYQYTVVAVSVSLTLFTLGIHSPGVLSCKYSSLDGRAHRFARPQRWSWYDESDPSATHSAGDLSLRTLRRLPRRKKVAAMGIGTILRVEPVGCSGYQLAQCSRATQTLSGSTLIIYRAVYTWIIDIGAARIAVSVAEKVPCISTLAT